MSVVLKTLFTGVLWNLLGGQMGVRYNLVLEASIGFFVGDFNRTFSGQSPISRAPFLKTLIQSLFLFFEMILPKLVSNLQLELEGEISSPQSTTDKP